MPKVSLLKKNRPSGTDLQFLPDSMSCFLSLLPVKIHISFPTAPRAGVSLTNENQAVFFSPCHQPWSGSDPGMYIVGDDV